MIASIFIILVSAALLAYWFRYTCVLILRTRTVKDYAAGMATANDLRFHQIQGRLVLEAPAADLPALQEALERDYRLLTYLVEHTAGLEVGGLTLEQRMLMIDFKAMRLVCALSRWVGIDYARHALEEMSSILNYLANAMGERIESTQQT
jgi:hypothetical protein